MKNKAYEKLLENLKQSFLIDSVYGLLCWDEQVNLPAKSVDVRAQQNAIMAELSHKASTDPEIGELLETLEKDSDLSSDEQLVVQEAAKAYKRETQLPSAFISKKATAQSKAYHAWTQARAENDFKSYAPHLQEQLDIAQEEAALLGKAAQAYDYWIDRSDPGMNAATIDQLFTALKKELVPFVSAITSSSIKPNTAVFKGFPVDQQEAFLKQVVAQLGFDFDHGRIDQSVHPFCGGIGADIRMTTRFDIDNPLDSLTSAIHETGHGLYEQGLPREPLGTALTHAIGMAVHESQSRLWENQVGRSRAFWNHFEPLYREKFPEQLAGISSEDFFLAINAVAQNPIRVDSDEVTYNLHIILRFEIEKRLFDGDLAVADLPEAWNQLSQELLGLTPKNDTEGVLQDVHWSGGAFGYFPSYCLGNMLAAQLWYQLKSVLPDIEERIEQGDFSSILGWLREHVHQQGRRMNTLTIAEIVTGKPLSPDALMQYLQERYAPLYL